MADKKAFCQPAETLRENLRRDLDIRGVLACPDSVDLDAIRLVYDFADHTRYTTVSAAHAISQDISPINGDVSLIIDFPNLRCQSAKLITLYSSLYMDAAGRAAAAAAGAEVRMHLRYNNGIVNIELGNCIWPITAAGGIALILVAGTHNTSLTSGPYLAPGVQFNYCQPIELTYEAGGLLYWEHEITVLATYPANSRYWLYSQVANKQ
jgi:hypothetical protein